MARAYNSSIQDARGPQIQGQAEQHSDTLSQNPMGRMCNSVVECLPGVSKALGAITGLQ